MIDEIKATDLVTKRGFTKAFWELYGSGMYRSQREAYEALEVIFFEAFGENRFPSFDAFRMHRDKKIR